MRIRGVLFVVSGLMLFLVAEPVWAESTGDALGRAGQIVISSDLEFSLNYSDLEVDGDGAPDVGGNTTEFTFGPAADYFVTDRVSLGGAFHITYARVNIDDDGADASDSWGIGIAPRVGYIFRLAENVDLWPKLGFEYSYTSADIDGFDDDIETDAFSVNLYVPFDFQIAPHFFIGVGPSFDWLAWSELSSDGDSVDGPTGYSVGFKTEIGGYF